VSHQPKEQKITTLRTGCFVLAMVLRGSDLCSQQESGARSRYPAVGRSRALQAPRELPGSGTCIFPKLRAEAELSVAFGRIFNPDQVLFNSVPIGAEGHIGEQAIEAEAHAKTRVYRVLRNAIHYGSDNCWPCASRNTGTRSAAS
jgi:hypothetical protein